MATYRRTLSYKLTIGKCLNLTDTYFSPGSNGGDNNLYLESYVQSMETNSYTFTEHDIRFEVKKSVKAKDSNKANITIYNLDDDAVNYMVSNVDKSLVVLLDAGDNVQGTHRIFAGTVSNVKDNFANTERQTDIIVKDGDVNTKNGYTMKAFAKGTSIGTMMQQLCRDMHTPIAYQYDVDETIDRPMTIQGNSWGILNKWAHKYGLQVSIDQGKVTITPETQRKSQEISFISNTSGLIGKVTPYLDATGMSTNNQVDVTNIKFRCLLDSALNIQESVEVSDGDYNDTYKITAITFTGNTRGIQWFCDVIAQKTDGIING